MSSFLITFIVAAFGYFVDVYDLILFGVVRIESLKAIGISEDQLLDAGILLINTQMLGMILGGFFWGILGDKKGRSTVMMTSILLYSLANIANAFVLSLNSYIFLRFIAGFGLSGEVGAAITLISESSPKHNRTLWTMGLTAFGLLGAVVAGLVGDLFHWKVAYLVGGSMGLILLFLRFQVSESPIFSKSSQYRGRIDLFVRNRKRFLKYLACIFVGVPIWYLVGILITFSPELMQSNGLQNQISTGTAILFCYIGLCTGDFLTGLLSHIFKTRRGIIAPSFLVMTALVTYYLNSSINSLFEFYVLCIFLGFCGGYWAVYVTMISESFGTNLRATAVVTITNWVRGSMVLLTLGVQSLHQYFNLTQSAFIVGSIVISLACLSLIYLSETFAQDLNFAE